jgi:hypothetical protein
MEIGIFLIQEFQNLPQRLDVDDPEAQPLGITLQIR